MKRIRLHRTLPLALLMLVGGSLRAELQTSINLSAPKLFNGNSGTFTVSQISGLPSVASGPLTRTYSGVMEFSLSTATGRYNGLSGNTYHGLELGPLYVFRSFLSTRQFTVVNSATLCPSTTTYNWMGLRYRSPTTSVNPMNAAAASFVAGGTLDYNPSGTHLFTSSSSFNMGPTLDSSTTYYLDGLSGATCSSGSMKLSASGGSQPFGSFGWVFFGDRTFVTIQNGGDPVIRIGLEKETLSAPKMAAHAESVFSGLYSSYDTSTSQTQNNVYLYPNAAGTTFTIYRADSLSDPSLKTLVGSLACTSLNTPSDGFCSGTFTRTGVAGTGNAVCMLSTQTPERTITCTAQNPSNTSVAVSIIGTIPAKSVLALTAPSTAASAAPGKSQVFNVTLTNISGRGIPSIANPSSGALQLSAPFSNVGAYTKTGGTCGSTLPAYSSCDVAITYAPSAVGSHYQVFRVAYDDGYFGTMNATVPIYGTSGLSSISVTPATATYSSGTTVQYVATAKYSDNSTQDVSSIVTWSTTNAAAALTLGQGTTSFLSKGSATIGATLAGVSGSKSITVTGGATIEVLGQDSATSFGGAVTGLNGPRGMIYAGNRLFLADTYNNRILIWDSLPSSNQVPPDRVLGQTSFNGMDANYGGVTASSMYQPFAMASDGTRLFVSDSYNHRVLIWNTIPTSNGQAADLVLGQPNMTSSTLNNGGISASTFNYPLGIGVAGGKLLVADFNNNRVLIWNSIPTKNGQAADVVLGQANFTGATANAGGISASSLNTPYGCSTDGTRVFVADSGNNRVLMWNSIPTKNNTAANVVLGQANFTTNTANAGGISASRMSSPRQVHSTGTKLIVSDRTNNRVLIWTTMPAANGAAANIVLGQPNMTGNTANNGGISAKALSEPYGVYLDSSRALVADINNNRILIWNSDPSANQQAADVVLGQPSFTVGNPNGTGYAASDTLNSPGNVSSDGTRLVVTDTTNNRVLIWNAIPTSDGQAADVVVGQPDLTSNTANNGGVSASRLSGPRSATIVGSKLIVADTGNNRVLIWNTIPSSHGAAANVVVGQSNMTSVTANKGGAVSQSSLSSPYSIVSDGTALFVADYGNNRILRWNAIPGSNGTNADIRVGQGNFTTGTAGTSSTRLSGPTYMAISGTNFVVSDTANSRVLIWTTVPTTNQPAANRVLGQPNLNSGTANNGGIASTTLNLPMGLYTNASGALFVADNGNNRVLGWSAFPTSNQQAANRVLGQSAFTTANVNDGGLSATSLSAPSGVYIDGTNAWVADTNNHRILVTPINAVLTIADGPIYDFGDLALNSSVTRTFVVTNIGAGSASSVGAGTPALSAPFSFPGGYPGTGGTCGTTLNSQSQCTVVVQFNPTVDPTTFSDAVRLTYNDGSLTQVAVVGVTGRALSRAALTFSNGATYAYGTKAKNTSTDGTLTLSNSSGVTASLIKEGTSSPISAPFTFKGGNYPGTGGTCGSVLPTGSTCTLVVRFTPTAATAYSKALTIEYYGGDSTLTVSTNLTGTGN